MNRTHGLELFGEQAKMDDRMTSPGFLKCLNASSSSIHVKHQFRPLATPSTPNAAFGDTVFRIDSISTIVTTNTITTNQQWQKVTMAEALDENGRKLKNGEN